MESRNRWANSNRRGFTLIELLTVIAIIAILAGLLFPVFAQVQESGRKGRCSTNLHQLVQAMKMYRDDWRVYPDALFGIFYGAPGPASTAFLRLGLDYVKDPQAFTCPNHPNQWKQDNTLVQPINRMTNNPYTVNMGGVQVPAYFPRRDSYDLQYRPNTTAGTPELHYNKKWTVAAAGLGDDPRQLIYKEPPDNTVVTYCLYHSSMNGAGNPATNHHAIVVFLSGRVQMIAADKMANWPGSAGYPWQVLPKP